MITFVISLAVYVAMSMIANNPSYMWPIPEPLLKLLLVSVVYLLTPEERLTEYLPFSTRLLCLRLCYDLLALTALSFCMLKLHVPTIAIVSLCVITLIQVAASILAHRKLSVIHTRIERGIDKAEYDSANMDVSPSARKHELSVVFEDEDENDHTIFEVKELICGADDEEMNRWLMDGLKPPHRDNGC